MPIVTAEQIAAGFESTIPNPQQAQDLQEVLTNLIAAAQFVATKCNDNRFRAGAIKAIQLAFSQARASIMTPPDALPFK